MPDLFGAIPVPVPASPAGYPTGDPALKYILDFLQAFLVTDLGVSAAWAATGNLKPAVNKTFPYDPREVVFNERDLPTLFMWRESGERDVYGEDWIVERTICPLVWVFPTNPRENKRGLTAFINALEKAIVVGIERGRTPGWIVAGDTDPKAATLGSFLYSWVNAIRFKVRSWKRRSLTIEMSDANPRDYDAVWLEVMMEEKLDYDLNRFPANAGTQITITDSATADVLDIGKAT